MLFWNEILSEQTHRHTPTFKILIIFFIILGQAQDGDDSLRQPHARWHQVLRRKKNNKKNRRKEEKCDINLDMLVW